MNRKQRRQATHGELFNKVQEAERNASTIAFLCEGFLEKHGLYDEFQEWIKCYAHGEVPSGYLPIESQEADVQTT